MMSIAQKTVTRADNETKIPKWLIALIAFTVIAVITILATT